MKITNQVTDPNYTQWIEKYASDVLKHAKLKCKEVIIEDIEPSKRIFLLVDGSKYTIRTWNYRPIKFDKNDMVCAECVEATLYKMVFEEDGSGHGEVMDDSMIKIKWKN